MTSSMEKCFLFPCLILLATSSIVQSQFDTGATVNECESLQPAGVTPSTGTAPFIVAVPLPLYTGGNAVTVFIASSLPSFNVRGLVIQARRANSLDTSPVGSFAVPTNNNLYRSLTCGTSTTGTFTNTDASTKTLPLSFQWTSSENVGDVNFFVSLVETNGNFWSRITQPVPLQPGLFIDTCPTPTIQSPQASWTSPTCMRDNTVLANSATCTPPSGSVFSEGNTEVTCTCTDQSETSSCSFIVTIGGDACNPNPCQNGGTCIEVTQLQSGFFCQCPAGFDQPTCTSDAGNNAPVANCPGDQIATAPAGSNSVSVDYGSGQCNDIEDGVFLANCLPPSGFQFGIETTAVVCSCTDSGGLVSSCSFTVTVGTGGPACVGNPCSGNECRPSTSSLAGYTCHSVVGTPCI